MRISNFPEANKMFGAGQEQYLPLPAYMQTDDLAGRIVCCWSLTWRERLKLLFTGKVWHSVLTFGNALQPQLLEINKPEMPYE